MKKATKDFISSRFRGGSIEEPGIRVMEMIDAIDLSPEEEVIMFHGLYISKLQTYQEVFGKKRAEMLIEFFREMEEKPL